MNDAISFDVIVIVHTKPCVVTFTAHGNVYIDEIERGFTVAAGGCGAAAKSSDEIGHVAALLTEHGSWTYDLPAEQFAIRYVSPKEVHSMSFS